VQPAGVLSSSVMTWCIVIALFALQYAMPAQFQMSTHAVCFKVYTTRGLHWRSRRNRLLQVSSYHACIDAWLHHVQAPAGACQPPSVRFCSLLRDAHMTDCEGTLLTFLDRPQHSNLQWLIDMVPHGQSLSDRDLIGAVLAADCGAMSEGIG